MKCPKCKTKTLVMNSVLNVTGDVVRRRHHCFDCSNRFTTYESTEQVVRYRDQKTNKATLKMLRDDGFTLAAIGKIHSLSRQRVWEILNN